ncbi:unnamed protein product [Cyclocybe aegerita]|uniref:Uncharacterized protein n=1 Tax=Cyclocybe aegerita TaxID=1973307 RepID=A0A8S0XDH2_CYCAE|nr:unnamed protein product [Cyclocybe aegerita]
MSLLTVNNSVFVGCTVVIRQDDMNISSCNFFNVPIEAQLLGSADGSRTVLVDSLVQALRDYIVAHPLFPVNSSILQALSPKNNIPSQYNWATSRVLEFGRSMEDPSHGFRALSNNVLQGTGALDNTNISGHILLSIMRSDWRLPSFEETWSHFRFDPSLHFIIIFHPNRLPNPFFLLGPQNNRYEALSQQNQEAGQGLPLHIPVQAPLPSFDVYGEMPEESGVVNFSSLEDLLAHLPISQFDIQNARFLEAETEHHLSLVAMVLNWRSMHIILDVLGLDVKSSDKKLTLKLDGRYRNLSALDVLEHFHWGLVSFNHKTLWYRWAFTAARREDPLMLSIVDSTDSKVQS